MKKCIKTAIALCLLLTLLVEPIRVSATAGSNMAKVLSYYQKKNYKKASQYNSKLSKYAKEACVNDMSAKKKAAYKKVIQSYSLDSKNGQYLQGVYFSDIDNDKHADMFLLYGSCEADLTLIVYQYKNSKAVRVARTSASHSLFNAYTSHPGIIKHYGHMGEERLYVMTLKNGKINYKRIGSRDIGSGSYLALRSELKNYVKYDSLGKPYVDYSILT